MLVKKKVGLVASLATLVISSIVGGFIYINQNTNAKEATEKQVLISSIDKQHDLEYQAKEVKAKIPVVSEEYPARTIPDSVVAPNGSDSDKEQTSAAPLHQEQSPPIKTTPAPQPVPAITSLSNADIQRLQSYVPYLGTDGSYTSFQDMYINERANCDGLLEKFSAITLNDYNQGKAEWLTTPTLVYRSSLSQYCVRGILSLTYYSSGNKFGLTPNVKYQREVEYRLRNSVTNGAMTLKLETINYLTDFKAVN